MNFDIAAFRAAFPQFVDVLAYPDPVIQGWVNLATTSAMGSWFALATLTEQQLLVAHLGALMSKVAAEGTAPTGALVSAGQGSVSASFTPPPVKSAWGYWLSSSPYGATLWGLLQIAGMGGDLVGALPERAAFRKVGGIW